ncbi:MAG TPA: glycosyltransferase [Planctomycetota bacterium]|nr:glycosyltransferase [Planctomycetota bacterium]
MSENQTVVSVVIINFNKKDFLRRTIASALELDWPELEVIVVDNASTDGAPDMVEAEFGERVRLVRRTENSPTAARNDGYRLAKGELVLSLDNDIIIPDKTVIQKAVPLFEEFPRVGALAFIIGTEEAPGEPLPEHWWYPFPIEEGKRRFFYSTIFSEGAVFFRASALQATGGYDPTLFHAGENIDLGFRLLEQGYDILVCPNLTCAELNIRGFLPVRRTKTNYLGTRNKLWIAWKHFPLRVALPYAIGRSAVGFLRSIRYGWVDLWARGMLHGVFAPKAIRSARRPQDARLRKRITEIERGIAVEPRCAKEDVSRSVVP